MTREQKKRAFRRDCVLIFVILVLGIGTAFLAEWVVPAAEVIA